MNKKWVTKKEFTAWLKSLNPNVRIRTGCSDHCPISEYFLSKGIICHVGGSHGTIFAHKESHENWIKYLRGELNNDRSVIKMEEEIKIADDWADEFVSRIDQLGISKDTRRVSPKECLRVLEEINL